MEYTLRSVLVGERSVSGEARLQGLVERTEVRMPE